MEKIKQEKLGQKKQFKSQSIINHLYQKKIFTTPLMVRNVSDDQNERRRSVKGLQNGNNNNINIGNLNIDDGLNDEKTYINKKKQKVVNICELNKYIYFQKYIKSIKNTLYRDITRRAIDENQFKDFDISKPQDIYTNKIRIFQSLEKQNVPQTKISQQFYNMKQVDFEIHDFQKIKNFQSVKSCKVIPDIINKVEKQPKKVPYTNQQMAQKQKKVNIVSDDYQVVIQQKLKQFFNNKKQAIQQRVDRENQNKLNDIKKLQEKLEVIQDSLHQQNQQELQQILIQKGRQKFSKERQKLQNDKQINKFQKAILLKILSQQQLNQEQKIMQQNDQMKNNEELSFEKQLPGTIIMSGSSRSQSAQQIVRLSTMNNSQRFLKSDDHFYRTKSVMRNTCPLWKSSNFKKQNNVELQNGNEFIQTDLLVLNGQNNKKYEILKEIQIQKLLEKTNQAFTISKAKLINQGDIKNAFKANRKMYQKLKRNNKSADVLQQERIQNDLITTYKDF